MRAGCVEVDPPGVRFSFVSHMAGLYFHIPFCSHKCGYCNLFSLQTNRADYIATYLETLHKQAQQLSPLTTGLAFDSFAIGGGTPLLLTVPQLEYLLDISGRTPYWICRQLFCDAVFSNYLDTAKDVGATMPSLMFIAEHWQDVAKPFVETQLPGYDTYVMGGHLMFYEYPEKWNGVLEDFLNKL